MRLRSNGSDAVRLLGKMEHRGARLVASASGPPPPSPPPRRAPLEVGLSPSHVSIGPPVVLGCACCHWGPTRACRAWRPCSVRVPEHARPRLWKSMRRPRARGTLGNGCSSGAVVRGGGSASDLPSEKSSPADETSKHRRITTRHRRLWRRGVERESRRSGKHAPGPGARILPAGWRDHPPSQAVGGDGEQPRSS